MQALGVVQTVDTDDLGAPGEALAHLPDEGRALAALCEARKGCGLDTDRKHVDAHRALAEGKGEVAACDPAFVGEIAAEIEGVIAGLKAHQVVVTERREEPLMMRQCRDDLRRRTRNVEEEANAILVAQIAQRLGEWDQVIVMDPDQIVGLDQLVELPGEGIVDPQVSTEIATREFSALELIV